MFSGSSRCQTLWEISTRSSTPWRSVWLSWPPSLMESSPSWTTCGREGSLRPSEVNPDLWGRCLQGWRPQPLMQEVEVKGGGPGWWSGGSRNLQGHRTDEALRPPQHHNPVWCGVTLSFMQEIAPIIILNEFRSWIQGFVKSQKFLLALCCCEPLVFTGVVQHQEQGDFVPGY